MGIGCHISYQLGSTDFMLVGSDYVQTVVSGIILLIFSSVSLKYDSRLRKYNNEILNIFWAQSTQYKRQSYGLDDRGISIRLPPEADFLSTFANLRKATIRFVMRVSLCPSVSMQQLGSHQTDFHET
jgi:hypothetical protein